MHTFSIGLPEDLILTGYCFENEADTEALSNAHYIADHPPLSDTTSHRNHFLSHNVKDQGTQQVTVMAFQHRSLPLWGVQFHPESVSTEHGEQMMLNFQKETLRWLHQQPVKTAPLSSRLLSYSAALPKTHRIEQTHAFRAIVKTLDYWIDPGEVAERCNPVCWLDSSRTSSPYSRQSILSTEPAFTLSYTTLQKQLTVTDRDQEWQETLSVTFFDYLAELVGRIEKMPSDQFQGGFVGYFGYEMKRESLDGYHTPAEQQYPHHGEPDAAFQFIDKFIVFDHTRHTISLTCLVQTKKEGNGSLLDKAGFHHEEQALAWMDHQTQLLFNHKPITIISTPPRSPKHQSTDLVPDVEHDHYLKNIDQCIQSIKEGDAYEICLTTRFRLNLPNINNFKELYTKHLRRNNPAPFSALVQFPSVCLMSSSPERFLSVSADHKSEMKPIKGTISRVLSCICEAGTCDQGSLCEERRQRGDEERKQQLWQDVKERAENLMVIFFFKKKRVSFHD